MKKLSLIILINLIVLISLNKTVWAGTYNCKYSPPYGCLVDSNSCNPLTETLYHEKCGPINNQDQCNSASFQCDPKTSTTPASPSSASTATSTTTSTTTTTLGPIPTPHPQPTPFKCGDTAPRPGYKNETEFDSLRPYQASPCSPTVDQPSKLCGNTMLINDVISVTQGDANKGCVSTGPDSKKCFYEIPRVFDIRVDPSQAELPIAGNTELTRNRYSATATIDNATQINDYLSWYLNGTVFRAEDVNRFKKDIATGIYDYSPLVDYAGPIRKLLPLVIQNQARSQQVTDAATGTVRHNQTVACIYGISIFKFDVTVLGFNVKTKGLDIGGIPAPCPAQDPNENWLQKLWDSLKGNFIQELKLSDWASNLPPEQKPGEKFQDFYQRYLKWRGKNCVAVTIPTTIPFIGNIPLVGGMEVMYCYDDAFNANYFANEFPWIPFTSTEDKLGDLTFNMPVSSGGSVVVMTSPAPTFVKLPAQDSVTSISTNLYFPHMEENQQLSQMLSGSYLPKDLQKDTSLGTTVPIDKQPNCKILDIRTNPGDKLFGDVSPFGRYSYTAKFDCDFTRHIETQFDPITHVPYEVITWEPDPCKKTASFSSDVNVETPMIDKTWSTLVAGNTSDFRRIFPKLGPAGLGDVKDIPAVSSNVFYQAVTQGTKGETSAGPNPAEIYFPHLGGISEYFLKAIQTLLRPKGFGETIEWGNSTNSGTIAADCKSAPPQNISGLITKEAFNTMAGPGSRALECYDYVVERAVAEGVDPALALFIWLNESRASNYSWSVHDFGVTASQYDKDIVGQMGEFIRLKSLLKAANVPECAQYGITDDLKAFAILYFSGNCNPDKMVIGPQGKMVKAITYYDAVIVGMAAMHK